MSTPTPAARGGSIAATIGLALALALAAAQPWGQTERQRTQDQIKQLQQDMAAVSRELKKNIEERDSLRAALRRSEVALGDIRRNIVTARSKLGQARDKLADLNRRKQDALAARAEQQQRIGAELRAAYHTGRQGRLKLLLNNQRPDTLARGMAYYAHLHEVRQRKVARYRDTLAQIQTLEAEIAATVTDLRATEGELVEQQAQLATGQQRREQDLALVEASIANQDQRLQQMQRDRQELERLLQTIEAKLRAKFRGGDEPGGFAALQGQLPWPTSGRPSNRFGHTRSPGNQKWQGLLIPAPEGGEVTAIHRGRVVFADWFRGSGLLLIIDHGGGFMSLYAHNQTLLRDVGEWVGAGAAIATVGNSGGRQEPALYFEIRENGQPVNPTAWLGAPRGGDG